MHLPPLQSSRLFLHPCLNCQSAIRGLASSSEYCVNLVKKRDYEHFLTNLLLPSAARQTAFAIRAFNIEISNVHEVVKERNIGFMRMQFWRDSIDEIYEKKKSRDQPVLLELGKAISVHNLSRVLFHRIIDSREKRLNDKPFESLEELDAYCHESFSSVNFLLLESLGHGDVQGHARHAVNQLGMAEGTVALLRGVPLNAANRRVYLPNSLLLEHKVTAEQVIRKQNIDSLKLVIEAVAARAEEHLENCRFRAKYLTEDEKLLMLPTLCVDDFLARISKVQCDIFNPKLGIKNSLLPAILYFNKARSKF